MSLSRRQGLLAKEISFIVRKGKRGAGEGVVMYALPNKRPLFRLSVVISAKVEKKSTTRNLIRRRTKEIFRGFAPHMRSGYDIVFVFKKAITSYNELLPKIKELLQKLYIIPSIL